MTGTGNGAAPRRRRGMIRAAASTIAVAAMTVLPLGVTPAGAATSSAEANASRIFYWSFKNNLNQCISTYASGAIRPIRCDPTSKAQQWRWVDSTWAPASYRLLKNRWTGKCLISSDPVKSGDCEDWTSRHFWNRHATNDTSPIFVLKSRETGKYLFAAQERVHQTDYAALGIWEMIKRS